MAYSLTVSAPEPSNVYMVIEEESEAQRKARLRESADPIVARLTRLASDAVAHRKAIETRWVEDLCQFMGVRSVSELTAGKADPLRNGHSDETTGESHVFVNMTRAKTNRTEGRLCDILFPADDKNWGIRPTPMPNLSMVAKRAMEEAKKATDNANQLEANPEMQAIGGMERDQWLEVANDLGPQAVQARKEIEEAEQRCQRMEREIEDQLVEGLYGVKARDAVGWACKIGIGVMKGPVVGSSRSRWTPGDEGYSLNGSGDVPEPACVSPFSFFPDWNATSMLDAEFVLERHVVSASDMRRMASHHGFSEDSVRELLREGPGAGTPDDLSFLAELRALTGETTPVNERFVIWEYHGRLETSEILTLMMAYAPEQPDRLAAMEEWAEQYEDQMVIVYFCNNRILKIAEYYPMDSGELMYSVFSLEKGQASVLGAIGVPRMMRDAQEVLNAAWRMMMDNSALSAGSQVLVDKRAVQPADGSYVMRPRKVWMYDSENGGTNPFQTFNIPNNQNEIAGIIALAKQFIDDETAMPSITEGGTDEMAPGAASTVGGFAMLLNAAGVNIRRMVKNWDDDITAPLIRRFYDWNMQYSSKKEIKGDMKVEARGTSVLMQREMQAPTLSAIATGWSTHPVLGMMLKPYGMARKTLQSLSIDPGDVLIDQEEYDKRIAQSAEQSEPADPQWTVRLQIAQMESQARLEEAKMQREVQMMRLAQEQDRTIAEIQADLAKARMASESSERKLAVELAAEERNAREARSRGRLPGGSGGAISFGSEVA